jgi:hypothetical protein
MLVDLRLAYANFNRRIRRLKENPPSPIPDEVAKLLLRSDEFLRFERRTEFYYQVLSDPNHKLSVEEQELHRGNFGTLLKQLDDDNKRLDGLLEDAKPTSTQEQFNELKQRVIYTEISNVLPVRLNELRAFLVHKGLMDKPHVQAFAEKWLSSIAVVVGLPALNVFTGAQIREMNKDLARLNI